MKVAVIGFMGWYGSISEWIADGFELNGHEVVKLDRQNISIPHDVKLAIFCDCSEDYSNQIPDDKNLVKIFWAMDSHMPEGLQRSVNMARKCDLTISSNYEYGSWLLSKFGIESFLIPVTYNDKFTKDQTGYDLKSREFDVVMIGHPNSQKRLQLWELLKSKYKCFTGRIETLEQYQQVMSHAKIVVNQPTEPWDIIINNRFFEAMGFRSLLIQKRLKTKIIEKMGFFGDIYHEKDFIYWKHMNHSRVVEELTSRIDYYLTNLDEAQVIADRAHEKVKRYSMSEQCLKVESIILSKFFNRL